MARKFVFPDPNDRSYNEPAVIVDQPKVLGLYNQESGQEKRQVITSEVREWFIKEAAARGWDESNFVGNQCTLGVDLPRHGGASLSDGK